MRVNARFLDRPVRKPEHNSDTTLRVYEPLKLTGYTPVRKLLFFCKRLILLKVNFKIQE
jgi:hypothetical protein